jgi:hypothetical protein
MAVCITENTRFRRIKKESCNRIHYLYLKLGWQGNDGKKKEKIATHLPVTFFFHAKIWQILIHNQKLSVRYGPDSDRDHITFP